MEAAPAEVTAEAIAAAAAAVAAAAVVELEVVVADTEEDTVEQVRSELFEKVIGSIDTVDPKANTGSGEAEPQLADWVPRRAPCNMEVAVWLG